MDLGQHRPIFLLLLGGIIDRFRFVSMVLSSENIAGINMEF